MKTFQKYAVLLFSIFLQGVYNSFIKFEPKILKKVCYLIPETGPCRANLSMYYFEPNDKKCKKFSWGGCQGNGNRFDTEHECSSYCLSTPETKGQRPRYCYLAFDYGYCFGSEMRWYYDRMWKVCKHTIFSGCGGNKNNFQTRRECARRCRYGWDNGAGGGSGSGSAEDGITREIIVNPSGMTKTTTCFKPWHSTTVTLTTTEKPIWSDGTTTKAKKSGS